MKRISGFFQFRAMMGGRSTSSGQKWSDRYRRRVIRAFRDGWHDERAGRIYAPKYWNLPNFGAPLANAYRLGREVARWNQGERV